MLRLLLLALTLSLFPALHAQEDCLNVDLLASTCDSTDRRILDFTVVVTSGDSTDSNSFLLRGTDITGNYGDTLVLPADPDRPVSQFDFVDAADGRCRTRATFSNRCDTDDDDDDDDGDDDDESDNCARPRAEIVQGGDFCDGDSARVSLTLLYDTSRVLTDSIVWSTGATGTSIFNVRSRERYDAFLYFNDSCVARYRIITDGVGDGRGCVPDVIGGVFIDYGRRCRYDDSTDVALPRALIRFTNQATGRKYFTMSDRAGQYTIDVPEGTYTVEPHSNRFPNLGTCDPLTYTTGTEVYLTTLLPVENPCPVLDTRIAFASSERCARNQAFLTVENRGSVAATNFLVTVSADEYLSNFSTDRDITLTDDGFTFVIDSLLAQQRTIIPIEFDIDCDAEAGRFHCLEAELDLDEDCVRPRNWSGALVDVRYAGCNGDEQTFTISNAGDAPMTVPLEHIIVEDGIMMLPAPTVSDPLEPGQEIVITLPANGSTYQVIANQEPRAPAAKRPSAVREGCGGFTPGFGGTFPSGNGRRGTARACSQNYDRDSTGVDSTSNLTAFPEGVGPSNDIEPDTRLSYVLTERSTGSRSSRRTLRLTLAPELDLGTFEIATTSHPGEVTLENGVLTYVAEAGPQETVLLEYTILPLPDLARGTVIDQDGVRRRIAPQPLLVGTRASAARSLDFGIYPNPSAGVLYLNLPTDELSGSELLVITDLLGRPLLTRPAADYNGSWTLDRLPAGTYFLIIRDAAGPIGRRPFILRR